MRAFSKHAVRGLRLARVLARPLSTTPKVDPDVEFWQSHGYLVQKNVFTPLELADLRSEVGAICRGRRGPISGLNTSPDRDRKSDDELMKELLAIHFPHKISPLMKKTMAFPGIVDTLVKIIGPNVKCMQSMLFVKHAGKPGQALHQDEMYIPTRDRSLTAAWIAIDDAYVDNGCLWIIPGSHKPGIIWPNRKHSSDEYDEGAETYGHPWQGSRGVPVEVKAGDVVYFHGYVLHRSQKNRTQEAFRRALVMHYCSAESMLPWDWDGRIEPRPHDNRDIEMVAGVDPYAYKGIQSFTFPLLRGESPDRPDPTKKNF